MADQSTIARPYAKALFDVANADKKLGPWSAALNAAAAVLGDANAKRRAIRGITAGERRARDHCLVAASDIDHLHDATTRDCELGRSSALDVYRIGHWERSDAQSDGLSRSEDNRVEGNRVRLAIGAGSIPNCPQLAGAAVVAYVGNHEYGWGVPAFEGPKQQSRASLPASGTKATDRHERQLPEEFESIGGLSYP